MKKVALIVNPVAGMGGKLGFKGTDGEEILARCRAAGAVPEAPRRVVEALEKLAPLKEEITVVTYPGDMGASEVREAGLEKVIVVGSIVEGRTTSADTRRAAAELLQHDPDLLIFAGGDGTARDIYSVLGTGLVTVGIPAGVKIHSGVYAANPRRAGELAFRYLTGRIRRTKEGEVMDIDEEAFRQGRVSAKLYGYLLVPDDPVFMQNVKAGGQGNEKIAVENAAFYVLDHMEAGRLYIIGPGTTTRVIKDKIGPGGTLLGVDVVRDKKFIARDVNEKDLLQLLENAGAASIIVTVIGGQGYIFGRGNQQISPRVIRKVGRENIIVVASAQKLASLGTRPLLVDTGDADTDRLLEGYIRVVTGYHEQRLWRVGQ